MLNTVTPDNLYKYRDTSEYHIQALMDDYLYFPYRKQVNDPYDIPIYYVDEQNSYFDEEHSLSLNNAFSDMGIFSLANNPYCPLMWAHYATCLIKMALFSADNIDISGMPTLSIDQG